MKENFYLLIKDIHGEQKFSSDGLEHIKFAPGVKSYMPDSQGCPNSRKSEIPTKVPAKKERTLSTKENKNFIYKAPASSSSFTPVLFPYVK